MDKVIMDAVWKYVNDRMVVHDREASHPQEEDNFCKDTKDEITRPEGQIGKGLE
jgi:hypothetical protein